MNTEERLNRLIEQQEALDQTVERLALEFQEARHKESADHDNNREKLG